MQRIVAFMLLTVFVGACAEIKKPLFLDPELAARDLRKVALAPVVFADEPIDRYSGQTAAEEIRLQTARVLKKMGYQIDLMTGSGNAYAGPPIVASGTDPLRIAPPIPPGSDAVIQIRVDHFLDAGLSDERSRIPLDIYATAALIADGRILWQGEGRGQGSWHDFRFGIDDYALAAAHLADSIFATLPPP